MSAIQIFLKRVVTSTNAKSKDIRLTLVEAQAISAEMAVHMEAEAKALATVNALQEKIIAMKEIASGSQDASFDSDGGIEMDGGKF